MLNKSKTVTKSTESGISYSVIFSGEASQERPYGILAVMENDKDDFGVAENLFFTEVEAIECCKWLARNTVYPVTLKDVMANFFVA